MSKNKIERIDQEIAKTREKIAEQQEKLKDLDSVAYVRFASVYREFKDVNTFMDELGKLLTSNSEKR